MHLMLTSQYTLTVNGNHASSEDAWNSLILRLPGVEYDGEIFSDQADGFSRWTTPLV